MPSGAPIHATAPATAIQTAMTPESSAALGATVDRHMGDVPPRSTLCAQVTEGVPDCWYSRWWRMCQWRDTWPGGEAMAMGGPRRCGLRYSGLLAWMKYVGVAFADLEGAGAVSTEDVDISRRC